jgi:hypothetical protein
MYSNFIITLCAILLIFILIFWLLYITRPINKINRQIDDIYDIENDALDTHNSVALQKLVNKDVAFIKNIRLKDITPKTENHIHHVITKFDKLTEGLKNGAIIVRPPNTTNTANNFNDDFNAFTNDYIFNLDLTEAINAENNIKNKIYDNKIKQAQQNANTNKDKINNFLNVSKHFEDDKQNVHDSAITSEIGKEYAKLKQTNGNKAHVDLKDIHKYIDESKLSLQEKARAKNVASVMHDTNTDVISIGDHEYNVLSNVWQRANAPENINAKEDIKQSIVSNLLDCYENKNSDNPVCSVGRITRVMSSLMFLDKGNEELGKFVSSSEYRNNALEDAQKILQKNIEKYKKEGDTNMASYAKTFDDPKANDKIPKEQLETVKKQFEKSVEKDVVEYCVDKKDKLPADMVEQIMVGIRTML